MDTILFELIHYYAGRWEGLDLISIFLGSKAGYALLFMFALIVFKETKKRWMLLIHAVSAVLLSRLVLTEIIRFLWDRPRPFAELGFAPLIEHAASPSFPSGHATFYFALSTVVFAYHKKLGALFFVVSLLMGYSRVFAGAHWPSDIIGGALIGIVSGLIILEFQKRRKEKNVS